MSLVPLFFINLFGFVMQSGWWSVGQFAILRGWIVRRNEPRNQDQDVQNSQEHNQPRGLATHGSKRYGSKACESTADRSSWHVPHRSEFVDRRSSAGRRQLDFPQRQLDFPATTIRFSGRGLGSIWAAASVINCRKFFWQGGLRWSLTRWCAGCGGC